MISSTSIANEDGNSSSAAELLARAETEYRTGLDLRWDSAHARPHFHEAALAYERLWQQGYCHPFLARNWAQSQLLDGNLAEAIRVYHLGLRLASHDRDLQAGLAYARDQVSYPATASLAESCRPRERASLFRYASADAFRLLAACFYLMACLAFARDRMTRVRYWKWTAGLLLLLAVVMAGLIGWEERRWAEENEVRLAIIARSDAHLHRGNGGEYPLRISESLPIGVELRVLSERGGWLQVQLAGGEVGWVTAGGVIAVE